MMRSIWDGFLYFAFAVIVSLCSSPPVFALEDWVVGSFVTAPALVEVDVVDLTLGTTVGDDLATTQIAIDGNDSIYHQFDLSTVTGYPVDCSRKTYLVQFIPDSADCQESVTPQLCSTVISVAHGGCPSSKSDFYTHTSTTVSAQGISQTVLNWYNARGMLVLKWVERNLSESAAFGTPDATKWDVYFYTDAGSAPRILCTVEAFTDPASSLPSSAHCQ